MKFDAEHFIPVKDVKTFDKNSVKRLERMQDVLKDLLRETRELAEETNDWDKVDFLERRIVTDIAQEAGKGKEVDLKEALNKPFLKDPEAEKAFTEAWRGVREGYEDVKPDKFRSQVDSLYENNWKGLQVVENNPLQNQQKEVPDKQASTPIITRLQGEGAQN